MKIGGTFNIKYLEKSPGIIGPPVLGPARSCLIIDVQDYDYKIHGGCVVDYCGETRIMDYNTFGEPYIRPGVALGTPNHLQAQCYHLLIGDDLMWAIKIKDVDTLYYHNLENW